MEKKMENEMETTIMGSIGVILGVMNPEPEAYTLNKAVS